MRTTIVLMDYLDRKFLNVNGTHNVSVGSNMYIGKRCTRRRYVCWMNAMVREARLGCSVSRMVSWLEPCCLGVCNA